MNKMGNKHGSAFASFYFYFEYKNASPISDHLTLCKKKRKSVVTDRCSPFSRN